METIILSKQKVKPSKPTPPHLKNHKLCFLDQVQPPVRIKTILFYENTTPAQNQNNLKNALSETLTLFYPLAGELKEGSTFVDCNDTGVVYVEAQAKTCLSYFLENPDLSQLKKLMIDVECHFVSFQVTRFECGGMAIGASMFHLVSDANTMSAFLNTWANIARERIMPLASLDFTSSSLLFPPQNHLPQELSAFLKTLFFKEGDQFLQRRFVFDSKAIAAIKLKGGSSSTVPKPTRVQALTALIWKHMMLASKAVKGSSSPSCMLNHAVNLRPRLHPPLPNASGNVVWFATTFYESEITSDNIDLSHLVGLVREVFETFSNGENLKELEGDASFTYLVNLATDTINSFGKVDNYMFTSWCRFGLDEVDFGWGKPIWVAPLLDPTCSLGHVQIVILVESGRSSDGIEAWILRNKEEILELENDEEFLQYASPNPSICIP
nr:PREDICTED: vinorine synthase-like [Nicotiana tabacum]